MPQDQARSPTPRALDVVTFGEAMLLLVGWASRLGADSMGRYLLATMQREGADCSKVVCDPAQRTGLMLKGGTSDGSDPPIEYHHSGSAVSRMGAADVDASWLGSARHLHAAGVFAALSASTLEATKKVFVSCATRAARSLSTRTCGRRCGLRLSRCGTKSTAWRLWPTGCCRGLEEGRLLTGETTPEAVAQFYRQLSARLVVVKLGPAGAYFDSEAGCGHVGGFPVDKVVDTVGAGDGFAVGVVSALLEGRSSPEAVNRGAWIGARAVQVLGDTEGLPIRAELVAAGL